MKSYRSQQKESISKGNAEYYSANKDRILEKYSQNKEEITRKEALHKIGNYGKYAALTALGTYIMLHPKKAQASSPDDPGSGF